MDFPYLEVDEVFEFPPVTRATPEGIVGVGGNLSPGMLASAYRQGIFPWFSPSEPILWWSPDPRFVLRPADAHVPRSARKLFRQGAFTLTADRYFDRVIEACAAADRPDQLGTWITEEMRTAYARLHDVGYAHSVEVWSGHELAGGLYGVSFGSAFFGESMFSYRSNASKFAFLALAAGLEQFGFTIIDCQVHTRHLERLGAYDISRAEFLEELQAALAHPTRTNGWEGLVRAGQEAVSHQRRDGAAVRVRE